MLSPTCQGKSCSCSDWISIQSGEISKSSWQRRRALECEAEGACAFFFRTLVRREQKLFLLSPGKGKRPLALRARRSFVVRFIALIFSFFFFSGREEINALKAFNEVCENMFFHCEGDCLCGMIMKNLTMNSSPF